MTTLTRREAAAGGPPPADGSGAGSDPVRSTGAGGWRGSWRVALRMARRDVRRHRGRSLVVLLMVGVPTALLVFGLTFYATSDITGAERIPYELGSAQARIGTPSPTRLVQSPVDVNSTAGGDTPSLPIQGYAADAALPARSAAIGRLLHGTAVPVVDAYGRAVIGNRRPQAFVLGLDGRAAVGDRLRLVSGRWPSTDEEVTVTENAVRRGYPTSGRLTLSLGGGDRVVTIVGTSAVPESHTDVVGLPSLAASDGSSAESAQWLILRPDPMTYAELKRLNEYGLPVTSAHLLRHPPPSAQIPVAVRDLDGPQQREQRLLVAAGGTILLVVTTLLVGPAFAVGAARQRRTLALAAANGAEVRQLRHTVLGQALVLGVLSALVGGAVGIGAVMPFVAGVTALTTQLDVGPFDVPWLQVGAIVAIAVVSSVVAALLPARRLGRLDIVGVMRGQNVSPRPSKVLPLVGLLVAAVGGWQLFAAVTAQGSEIPVVAGGIALILGSLLIVPTILVAIGRLASPFWLPLRMAARDAARQRARSAPAVGAVLGAVAALTMMLVGLSSDTTQSAREYQATNLRGEGTVWVNDARDATAAAALIRQEAPDLQVATVSAVAPNQGPVTGGQPFVMARPSGCSTKQIVVGDPSDQGPHERCQRLGTLATLQHSQIGTLPSAEITRRLGLDARQSVKVRDGAIVILTGALPRTGAATFVSGRFVVDDVTGMPKDVEVSKETRVPVVDVALTEHNVLALNASFGAVVTPETAARLNWPTAPSTLLVHAADGAIPRGTADRINDKLTDLGAELQVENGFHREDWIVMAILVGVFALLLLVITLTTTALTLAEQQADQSTLAAVGATRATRRSMAAAQSFVVAGVGALLGLGVGLVPGIAIAHPLTRSSGSCDSVAWICTEGGGHGAIVDIPWLWLAVAVVGIPLVAACVSWVAVRKAPLVTRRAT